jgi:hypothetical protein
MRIFILFFLVFLYFHLSWAIPKQFYHIEQQTSDFIIIQFHFPDPEISPTAANSPYSEINVSGLNHNYVEGKPFLPLLTTSVVAPEGKASWKILASETVLYPNVKPILYFAPREDQAIKSVDNYPSVSPLDIIRLTDAGIFRDYRIMGLTIYPAQVIPGGVKFFKSLKVKIQFPKLSGIKGNINVVREQKIFQKIAINANNIPNIAPSISKSPQMTNTGNSMLDNQFDRRLKFVVDQEGIYKVSGQDFIDGGISIQDINPQTFRLTNKGNDIAIFIFGNQDLAFDPSDYIEFLGEPNQKTFLEQYPDMYSDPFSDENVYWISWGGSPGIRMVEESGAIVTTNPTQFNPSQFYPHTVHFETNLSFERFGFGNTQKLSHTRDLWYFDFGIQAISKKTYPVELIYPDSSSFNPVTVKMVFAGKSQTQHSMMSWLNQRLVGQTEGEWFGQNIFTLNNSLNSTIRTIDLRHGINNLEIQMPSFAAGGKSDFIAFNWADITYDRQYKAHQNLIEFTKPSVSVIYYPNVTLFQFEILNFTRPDIEIYKKGISKIVNYNLDVQEGGSSTRYKITFQDNIYTDDVQYIALASDAKLKPKRIEKDEPYDEVNPTILLTDPSNSADYIIITHQRFYERGKELLELRRQDGLNAVMIKVQDIYDEFNDGIKSPIAIKEFIEYAFYNWDRNHRLKYVVFLGDANFNYKLIGTQNDDFVPTFFYQTIEFGAVATDFPYSLVAGEDLLPDIFVGRIPVTTNGEVTNVIAKIREYQENPDPGSWLNQSLFISGNDASTSEFINLPYIPKKPAFRTQNQRVIDMLVDKRYSAFKLNTIKDDSLQFDPNFGGTTDLIDYFDNGVHFVNFFGHGGGGIWADVQLLNLQDIDRLNNKGKYPFVTSMTCFTGAFDNPGNPGLAQKLLLTPDKGAIGILASSGLGWLANDYSMLWNVMKYISEPDISVGEAVTIGKIDYFINSQYVVSDTIVPGYQWGHPSLKFDMVYQYNLVGDPYTILKQPQNNIDVRVDNDLPQPGDTINIQVTAPYAVAEGYLELANGENEVVNRDPLFYSGNQLNLPLRIPENFGRGAGYVRAFLSDNNTTASGVKQIGVNFTVFDSVSTIPASPNAEDSVGIYLELKDDVGVSEVRIVAILPKGVIPQDTVHLLTRLINPNTYETIHKIPPTFSLNTVYYFVYVTNSQGQQSRMSYSYRVQDVRPDPLLFSGKIRFVGEEKVKLGITVGNSGEMPAENVELKVYNGKQNFELDQSFAQQVISVDGKDSITSKLDFDLPLDLSTYDIFAWLDRQQQIPDFNRLNNSDSANLVVSMYNLTPDQGSTYRSIQNDTINIGVKLQFWLEPATISEPSAVLLRVIPFPEVFVQKEISPIHLGNASAAEVSEIVIYNKESTLSAPFLARIFLNETFLESSQINYQDVKLYRWNQRMRVWLQQDAIIDSASASIIAYLTQDGIYAPFTSGDNVPPRIELTIDGRQVRAESLVSPTPVLNIIAEDESGLNSNRDQIDIRIDDLPIDPEKVFVPDSVRQSNVLGITVYPELDLGKHELSIEIKDVNGNDSRKEYLLQVDDDFDLHVYGNYPNPFSDMTIFSYYITSTEILDDLEIRIFTTSGRLIKRIKNDINTMSPGNDPRRVGYNELMWDGTDEDGNDVANGVYFAMIRAKFEDKVKEEILKVAKLK